MCVMLMTLTVLSFLELVSYFQSSLASGRLQPQQATGIVTFMELVPVLLAGVRLCVSSPLDALCFE